MSFVRQERGSMNNKKTQAKDGKLRRKTKKRAPAWDGTTSDLSVHRLSKSELERRREVHKSGNLPAVKAERQMRSLIRRGRHSHGDLDKSNLLQEILYDEEQLRDAVGYSDRIMAVVHDLFGDDPSRKAGRANVTLAPGVASEKSAPKMLPDMTLNPSHLDILSESVMDPHALNELDSEEEYSGDSYKENTPEGYEGSSGLERFRRYIEKESRAKKDRTGQKTLRARKQDGGKHGRKSKERKPLNEYNDLSEDDSDVDAQHATRVQAINDTAKVKKKSLARTSSDSQAQQRGDEDLVMVIHGVKDKKKDYEEEERADSADGITLLTRRVEEQSNLINALTMELMSTQERLSGVEVQLQEMRKANKGGLGQSEVTRVSHPKPTEDQGAMPEQTWPDLSGGYSSGNQPEPLVHQDYATPRTVEDPQRYPPVSYESQRNTHGQVIEGTSGKNSARTSVGSHERRSQEMHIGRENHQRVHSGHVSQKMFSGGNQSENQPCYDDGVNLNQVHPDYNGHKVFDAHVNNDNDYVQGRVIDRNSSAHVHQEMDGSYPQVTGVIKEGHFQSGRAILLSPPRQRDRHTLFEARVINPAVVGEPVSAGRGEDEMLQNGSSPDSDVTGGGHGHPGTTVDGHPPRYDQFSRREEAGGKERFLFPRDAIYGSTAPMTLKQPTGVRGDSFTAPIQINTGPKTLTNPSIRADERGHIIPVRPEQSTNPSSGQQSRIDATTADRLQIRHRPSSTSDGSSGRPMGKSESSRAPEASPSNAGNHHSGDRNISNEDGAAIVQLSRFGPGQVSLRSDDKGPKDSSLLSTDSCSTYHSLPQMQDVGNQALVSSRLLYQDLSGSGVFTVPNQEWDLSDAGFGVEQTEAETIEAISDLSRKIAALSKEHAEAEERIQAWKSQESPST